MGHSIVSENQNAEKITRVYLFQKTTEVYLRSETDLATIGYTGGEREEIAIWVSLKRRHGLSRRVLAAIEADKLFADVPGIVRDDESCTMKIKTIER